MTRIAGILTIMAVILLVSSAVFGSEINVSLSPRSIVAPGDLIAVDLDISTQDSTDTLFIDGFEFRIAYDSSVITFWDMQDHGLSNDCHWFTTFMNDSLEIDSTHNYTSRFYAQAIGNSSPFPSCRFPTEPLATFLFKVHYDSALFGSTVPIDFIWENCHDNRLWKDNDPTVFIADSVYDSQDSNITNYDSLLPSLSGPHSDCFAMTGDTVVEINVLYHSTLVAFIPLDAVGTTGDIDLDGHSFETEDLSLFSAFFLYGDSVFSLAKDLQMSSTDIDGDHIDTTLADLALTRYELLHIPSFNHTLTQPEAQFVYDSSAGIITVFVDTDTPMGAYNLWLVKDQLQVDSVTFADHGDIGEYGKESAVWLGDTLRILFIGGQPAQPAIGAGVSKLFTIYYTGASPIPMIERATSIEAVNYNLLTPTDINQSQTNNHLPTEFVLFQNYPNPFNPSTTISFNLPKHTQWHLEIVNLLGQKVRSFARNDSPGNMAIYWDGTDYLSQPVSSGVYFYRLIADEIVLTKKMLLIK